jgi:hypothetical protein
MGTTFIGTTEMRMDDQLAALDLTDKVAAAGAEAKKAEAGSDRQPFHVHFGLGHLGCGLIIPALTRKGINFALVNRPSKQWGELVDSKKSLSKGEKLTVAFKVNGEPVGEPIAVIADLKDLEESGPVGGSTMVALTEDKELLKQLMQRATSFSSSLGNALKKVLPPMFDLLDDKSGDDRPIMYACENEHQAVDELEKTVSALQTACTERYDCTQ